MPLVGSLRQLIAIFYRSGNQKLTLVFGVSLLGICIELVGLMWLYLVVSGIIQASPIVSIPLTDLNLSLWNAVFILVGVYLFKFIFSIWQNKFLLNYCYDLNYNITSQIITHYYKQPTEVFKNTQLADALNKVFTIGGYFSEIIFQSVLIFFSELILTLFIALALLIFNFKLLLLLLVVLLPVCLVLLHFSRKKLKAMSKKILSDNVQYHQAVMTLIHGLLDIKLSGRFSHFFELFNTKINNLQKTKKVINLENHFPPKVLEFAAILGIATLFFLTTLTHTIGSLTNLLAAFATAAFRFIPSANRIIGSIQNVKLYNEYIGFIYGISNDKNTMDEIADDPQSIASVRLENISYSYTENLVLDNFSLKLEAGFITGISGASGVGKTTLINIISGVLAPKTGCIYLNNKPLNPELISGLQHRTAYVMQDPYFLTGTVAENIVFGYDKSTDFERLKACMDAVKLDTWVQQQPQGLNTEIGDNGTKLSGGQKQRLAIARALYRNAGLLILDEPSNSLDSSVKHEVLNLISDLTKQKQLITIIVSHDADVLAICNSVIRLPNANEV